MAKSKTPLRFETRLLQPVRRGNDESWSFIVLPKDVSEKLPRRGRTTVAGTINGHPFQATLEPDGQLSHWLKIDGSLRRDINARDGDTVVLEISPLRPEPEPEMPPDFGDVLMAAPEAKKVWDATTTIARVDWIHWITSAKQEKTRMTRIQNACDMLSSGKRRVCCFDQSGFYSKSLSAPEAAEPQT